MRSIGERFEWIIKDKGISVNAFAKSIGKTHTYVSNIIENKNKPGFEVLELVCDRYPDVNPSWLLTGEGAPKSKEKTAPDSYLQEHIKHLEESFSKLATQLEKKDEQIENLHEMLKMALGKSDPGNGEPKIVPFISLQNAS